jgi:integrase
MVYRHHGKWMYDFWQGRMRQRQGGYKTKQDAVTAEAKARVNLKKTNSDFIALCESRLQELKTYRTPKYLKENQTLFKKLVLRWGRLKTIAREDVEDYLRDIPYPQVANKELRLIKALFNHGIDREWFNVNPTARIKMRPVDRKKKYIPPIEDVRKVLAISKGLDRLYLLVMIHTMGRSSSVNKIRWEDNHADYVSLYTRKSKNSDLKEIKIPKNKVLIQALSKIPRKGEYLFTNKDDKPYDYRKKLMKGLCKRAGVKPFGFHALRHFGASLLDQMGVPLTDIQMLLGHEKATTTDHYLQSLRGSTAISISKLEGVTTKSHHQRKKGHGNDPVTP